MGWFDERKKFFDSIKKYTARHLNKADLIKEYIKFMTTEYGHTEDELNNQWNEFKRDYKTFDDFIYSCCIGLKGDLRNEYETLLNYYKEQINKFKTVIHSLDQKIKVEEDKYLKGKYKFIRKINDELLTKATERRSDENIFKEACFKCSKFSSTLGLSSMFRPYSEFWSLEQYENTDWKYYINFGHLPIPVGEEIKKLKHKNRQQYVSEFKNYIDDYDIVNNILSKTKNSFYLHDRLPIFTEAIRMFKAKKYVPFVYLIVPQIEGMFDVYKNIIGIQSDDHDIGLCDKLEVIKEKNDFFGYIYYAFDFPKLRNDIAHGAIIDISEECAYDILMDLNYLIELIDSDSLDYKKMLAFFEEFNCGQTKESKINIILEKFSGIWEEENLKWLSKYLSNDFKNLIDWYEKNIISKEFSNLLNSTLLQKGIFNDEPLTTVTDKIIDEKKYHIKHINEEVLKYVSFIEILSNNNIVSEEWKGTIDRRIIDIEKEQQKI